MRLLIVKTVPTPDLKCVKIAVRFQDFDFARGICFRVDLINALEAIIDVKELWLEGPEYENWPVGSEPSDYLKSFLLRNVGLQEAPA